MNFPEDFSLIVPIHTPVSTELACKLIPALLDENHPFKMEITYNSGVVGKTDKWVEVRANSPKGQYVVCFRVMNSIIITLLAIISPTGSSWSLNDKGEAPGKYVTQEQWQALTRLLIPPKGVISIRPLFQLVMDGAKPCGPWMDIGPSPNRSSYPRDLTHGRLFESEEEAEKIKQKLSSYFENALTREPKGKK